jgi:hypothetical protein
LPPLLRQEAGTDPETKSLEEAVRKERKKASGPQGNLPRLQGGRKGGEGRLRLLQRPDKRQTKRTMLGMLQGKNITLRKSKRLESHSRGTMNDEKKICRFDGPSLRRYVEVCQSRTTGKYTVYRVEPYPEPGRGDKIQRYDAADYMDAIKLAATLARDMG